MLAWNFNELQRVSARVAWDARWSGNTAPGGVIWLQLVDFRILSLHCRARERSTWIGSLGDSHDL